MHAKQIDGNISMSCPRVEPQSTNEPSLEIPSQYLAVDMAGSGEFGDVHFCVPKSFATSTKDLTLTEAEQSPNMANAIQVVKVTKQQGNSSIADEVAVLKTIQQGQQELESDLPFFELIAWDTDSPIPRWLATSTLPLCCDLGDLCEHEKVFPKLLVWLTFVQLYEGLDFLHRICDPHISHNDLHEGNLAIGYSPANATGLPQIKIIDFGFARPKEGCQSRMSEKDAGSAIDIVYNMILYTYPDEPDELKAPVLDPSADEDGVAFYNFEMEFWTRTTTPGQRGYNAAMQRLWQPFSDHAKSQVASASASSVTELKNIIQGVAQARSDNLERRIVELVNDDTIT